VFFDNNNSFKRKIMFAVKSERWSQPKFNENTILSNTHLISLTTFGLEVI